MTSTQKTPGKPSLPSRGGNSSFSLKNRHASTPPPELQQPLRSSSSSPSQANMPGTPSKYHHEKLIQQQQQSPLFSSSSASLEDHILQGLTMAGVASCLLSTIFNLFHVDMFLNVFDLPLPTYSWGRGIFSILSTASSLMGAWWIDSVVATRNIPRQHLVGWAGCGLSLCFLLPFVRWAAHTSSDATDTAVRDLSGTMDDHYNGAGVGEAELAVVEAQEDDDSLYFLSLISWKWLDGAHFVISMTLYDTLLTMTAILLGAAVADDHHMTDHDRVHYMASSQMVNLVASLAIARLGLSLFDTTDPEHHLRRFQWFVVGLALVAMVIFSLAQAIIVGFANISGGTSATTTKYHLLHHNSPSHRVQNDKWWQLWKSFPSLPLDVFRFSFLSAAVRASKSSPTKPLQAHSTTGAGTSANARPFRLRHAAGELWHHSNFCVWICMEVLLEAQTSFVSSFLKTFVDRLLWEVGGVSRASCDWFLSLVQPLQQIAAVIFMYGPIRRFGYKRVYWMVFVTTSLLSTVMLLVATPNSTVPIGLFLVIYPVASEAIRSAGFHLVLSDLVLERKRHIAVQGKVDQPSLAGILLGATTLFCKPMQSILPIIAATIMHKYDHSRDSGTGDSPQDDDEEEVVAEQNPGVGDIPEGESASHLHMDTQTVLFYLLIVPAWVCSLLQLIVWSKYNLDPTQTSEYRTELQELERQRRADNTMKSSDHRPTAPTMSNTSTAIRRHHGHGDV